MSHCDYCADERRARVVAAFRQDPREKTYDLAKRLCLGRHFVRRVRLTARHKGCLDRYFCRCGTETPKGGRCPKCEHRVVLTQQAARDRAKWNPRHSSVQAWLLPPIGAAYVRTA